MKIIEEGLPSSARKVHSENYRSKQQWQEK